MDSGLYMTLQWLHQYINRQQELTGKLFEVIFISIYETHSFILLRIFLELDAYKRE